MQWWERAIKPSIILIILVVAFDVIMAFQMSSHPASGPGTFTQEQLYGKLGDMTGTIVGIGLGIIWILAYKKGKT